MKRILIADDHDAVRSGLRAILEQRPDWSIVAEAADGRAALQAALRERPDVAILDLFMPGITGLEVTKQIKKNLRETEVLIFTVQDSEVLAQEALRSGARAVLVKSDASKLLLAAVRALVDRKPFPGGRVCLKSEGKPEYEGKPYVRLSTRETLIVKLVAEGFTSKEICAFLSSNLKTTETHRSSAMLKLGVHSVAGLVRYAVRANLIDP